MHRRGFIAALGGVAAASSARVARAQPSAMPVIGFVRSTTLADSTQLLKAFRQGLQETGFVEDQNVAIEYRWADNQIDRLPALVADLVGRPVTIIVGNSIAARAAIAATKTVPIVFATGIDPVRDGLVVGLNRPGANVTGVVFFSDVLGAKRLELLRQFVPKATAIVVLTNPDTPDAGAERREVQASASAIGQQLIMLEARNSRDIEAAFATIVRRGAGALLTGAGSFLFSSRDELVALAARHAIPAIFTQRQTVEAGGLMSYGPSNAEAYRLVGIYAGRILKGERPSDLPVVRSTKFEFVINLKTAKALGIEVPDRLLALADEVIE